MALTPPSIDQNTPGANRRSENRRVLRTRVVLVFPSHPPFEGRTLDIASGGLGLEVPYNLHVGEEGTVGIQLLVMGVRRLIEARVRVANCICHTEGFRIGLSFVSMNDDSRKAILDYLKS